MSVEFTAHNIRLDDGSRTKPDAKPFEADPWLISTKRLLDTVFAGNKEHLRLVDLGCLEGGYSVEFARMGLQVLGLDVRQSNIDACNFVQTRTHLPNLSFAKDDVYNIANHGSFDAAFCCGLLYHLDRPREFLNMLGAVTKKLLILQTHYAPDPVGQNLPRYSRYVVQKILEAETGKFQLSPTQSNEGLLGRWYPEFSGEEEFRRREAKKWASWDNTKSFWLQRSVLLQTINESGFDLVMEQFDSLAPNIADSMQRGYYKTDFRGTFIGIKTGALKA